MEGIPVYKEVYIKLKRLIRDGEYGVGDFLPTEGQLENMFSVSRTTVRKAMELLATDGYIEIKQGRGTRVVDYGSTQGLNCLTSVSETLRNKGMQVCIKSIYIDIVEANVRMAARLHLKEGDKIFRVQRVLLADEVPIAIMENFIDYNIAPMLDARADEVSSLYHFLEEEYDINLDSAKDSISAQSSSFVEAQLLDIRVGAALVTLRRVTYSNGKPITYDKTLARADKYSFEVTLQGRQR